MNDTPSIKAGSAENTLLIGSSPTSGAKNPNKIDDSYPPRTDAAQEEAESKAKTRFPVKVKLRKEEAVRTFGVGPGVLSSDVAVADI